jgi:hypothetical protein
MLMPKCHPEMAGRGIEYTWGYLKLHFRNQFNKAKQKHLEENVRMALTTDVLTLQRIQKFAHKAREYTLTYVFLSVHEEEVGEMSKSLLDHITRHRSALESDYAFIRKA